MTKKQKSKILSTINLVIKDALDQITEILQDNSLVYDCTIDEEHYCKNQLQTFEKDLKVHKKMDAKYIMSDICTDILDREDILDLLITKDEFYDHRKVWYDI